MGEQQHRRRTLVVWGQQMEHDRKSLFAARAAQAMRLLAQPMAPSQTVAATAETSHDTTHFINT
jgi:hypothetical protein